MLPENVFSSQDSRLELEKLPTINSSAEELTTVSAASQIQLHNKKIARINDEGFLWIPITGKGSCYSLPPLGNSMFVLEVVEIAV